MRRTKSLGRGGHSGEEGGDGSSLEEDSGVLHFSGSAVVIKLLVM